MQQAKARMKDSYKVLTAVILSVATVFGMQYGVLNYFSQPDGASAQTSGVRVQPGEHFTAYYKDTLTASTTRNDDVAYAMPWENFFSHIDNKRVPTLIDVNGDGLTDMIYSYISAEGVFDSTTYGRRAGTQWIVLNVGDGYELVYFCNIENQKDGNNQVIDGSYEYKGDCAA